MKTKTSLPLPRGATLLKNPAKRKIAGWYELIYDAKMSAVGVVWYRVQGGFGSQHGWGSKPGDYLRDDWVADVPAVCVSVGAGDWHTPVSGGPCEYSSMFAAMRGELEKGLEEAKQKHRKACALLAEAHNASEIIAKALGAP